MHWVSSRPSPVPVCYTNGRCCISYPLLSFLNRRQAGARATVVEFYACRELLPTGVALSLPGHRHGGCRDGKPLYEGGSLQILIAENTPAVEMRRGDRRRHPQHQVEAESGGVVGGALPEERSEKTPHTLQRMAETGVEPWSIGFYDGHPVVTGCAVVSHAMVGGDKGYPFKEKGFAEMKNGGFHVL